MILQDAVFGDQEIPHALETNEVKNINSDEHSSEKEEKVHRETV
jgi:hypothetical protein